MTHTDEAKGRIKEAAGAIKGDRQMKREGKVDQASGKIKEAVEKARNTVADKVHSDR